MFKKNPKERPFVEDLIKKLLKISQNNQKVNHLIVHEILSYKLHFSSYFSTNEQQNQQILFNNDSCNQSYLNGVEPLFHNGCDFGILNIPQVSIILGNIYTDGEYITRDINKAIHYFSHAADQNHLNAQFILGIIYYTGEYIKRDINKAHYYLSQVANQNYPDAQIILANIYYTGEYITPNINKSIYYLSLAANQNNPKALYLLGFIYYSGHNITQDVVKVIYYFSLAANQNHPDAQYFLGSECFKLMDIKKGIHYLIRSSLNGSKIVCFAVGYLYHEGKYMARNIRQSLHFYKEASSFNNQYAKNNLGIIYKNGIENEIEPRLGSSIDYFEEAIRQENDKASMYNLAHLYFYEESINHNYDKSIDLLIQSFNKEFVPSLELLSIILFIKIWK